MKRKKDLIDMFDTPGVLVGTLLLGIGLGAYLFHPRESVTERVVIQRVETPGQTEEGRIKTNELKPYLGSSEVYRKKGLINYNGTYYLLQSTKMEK